MRSCSRAVHLTGSSPSSTIALRVSAQGVVRWDFANAARKAKATFHLTNIDRSGDKVERHLCDKCASEEGLLQTSKATVDLNEILENFIAGK